jgi:CRISPR-associated protein Cmr2
MTTLSGDGSSIPSDYSDSGALKEDSTLDTELNAGTNRLTEKDPIDLETDFPEYEELRTWCRNLFGGDIPLALLYSDVDGIQNYVFESAKLAEMRGASLVLDLLNVKSSDEEHLGGIQIAGAPVRGIPQVLVEDFNLPHECVIYSAGGSALIIAPRDKADEIKERIQQLYVETTLMTTVTVVSQPVELRDLVHGIKSPVEEWFTASGAAATGEAWRLIKAGLVRQHDWTDHSDVSSLDEAAYYRSKRFGQLYAALNYRLRRQKESKQTAPLFEVSPVTERCSYCHFRPAYTLAREIAERPICRACDTKRKVGSKGAAHSHYIDKFKSFLFGQNGPPESIPYLSGIKRDWDSIESPPDLEAVAAAGKKKAGNYVGIIYADGNDMGAAIEGLGTLSDFRQFAMMVRRAIETAVFSGLGHLLSGHHETEREHIDDRGGKHRRKHTYHPFEIVSIGGDDVYLFVPADIALELAVHICRKFEASIDKDFERELNRKLTLSAGVLLAHVNTPVYFSRTVVKGLLSNAKRLSKSGEKVVSTIDFQVITTDTAASEDIPNFRDRAYLHPRFDERLTTRPLTVDALAALIELTREMKTQSFPLSQLYLLRESVTMGPQPRATNFYYYQMSRSEEVKKKYGPLHHFLNSGHDERTLPFWDLGGQKTTPIADIAEIYNFVRGPEKEESGEKNL